MISIHRTSHAAIAAVLALLSATTSLLAQGSLTPPPGAPSPQFKTLNQVEPRTPISQQTCPGSVSATHVISLPGHYYLTGSINGQSPRSGIRVDAQNVVIDLNGFTLEAVAGCTKGIEIYSAGPVLIRNGALRWWPQQAVWSNSAVEVTMQDVLIQNTNHRAIDLTGSGVLERVTIKNAVEYGIHWPTVTQLVIRDCRVETITGATAGILAPRAQISGCTVTNVTGAGPSVSGIYSQDGMVQSCTVRQVTNSTSARATGIWQPAVAVDCSVSDVSTTPAGLTSGNSAGGITSAGRVSGCKVWNILNATDCFGISSEVVSQCHVNNVGMHPNSTDIGISGMRITDCYAGDVVSGAGIQPGTSGSVSGCTAENCQMGIKAYGRNLITGNSLMHCTLAGILVDQPGNRILHNMVYGNFSGSTYGIYCSTVGSFFDGNTAGNCLTGFKAEAGSTAVFVRNAASTCTTKYDIPASMIILTPAALGTNPNANITE